MKYSIVIERITDGSLSDDYFYAHIPTLDLTTHGLGIEEAKKAAIDLIKLWIVEKKENNEKIPIETDVYYSEIEIDDAILSA